MTDQVGRFRREATTQWWISAVRPAVITAAKRTTRDMDAAGRKRFDSEARWQGYIGERGLRAWLEALHVPALAHGGVDNRPDLVVHGHGVAVKTTGHRERFRPAYWCPYPKAQLDAHPFPEVFWCAFKLDDAPTLTLLGGMNTADFLAAAEVVPKGAIMESGREASYDFYRVRAADLQTPINWLCRLDLAQPKEAASNG